MGRSADEQVATAELRAEVIRRKRQGETYAQIGEALGFSRQRAYTVYREALEAIPALEVRHYREEQLDRLDQLLRAAHEVLGATHVVVSQGRVMYETDAEGNKVKLLDDGPKLQAVRTILAIEERRAKLLGLDAPVKTDLGGGVELKVSVVGVDVGAMR